MIGIGEAPFCEKEKEGREPAIRVVVGRDDLEVDAVTLAARSPHLAAFSLDEDAAERMAASVRLRDRLIATGRPIYGVTTGFGDSARFHLNPSRTAALQHNLIRYHLNGSGPRAELDVARATMLIRANCLARGYSGVRRDVIDLLLAFLHHDIVPLIPERGSVGASGDLVPLCYLAEALVGDGEVEFAGTRVTAAEAMRVCDLQPLTLAAKEGLALINGTSFMAAFACLAAHDARSLALLADVCTALACEALEANPAHFEAPVHRHKPHPGQVSSARRISGLLESSRLVAGVDTRFRADLQSGTQGFVRLDRAVQEPYSLRCAPHVNGVLLDTLDWVMPWLQIEINSSNDNPLFEPDTGQVLSGGNFYGGHVGQAMDSLKTAVASLGDLLDRQLALLVDDKFNRGLPPNLSPRFAQDDPDGGIHHGFKGAQIASSALAAEALKLSNPATVFSRSTEAHNQDKVSMGTIAARDARTVVELVREIGCIHLLACCQAVEMRGIDDLAPGTRAVFDFVRRSVPVLEGDRRLDTDLSTLDRLIGTGALEQAVAPYLPDELPHEHPVGTARHR